MSHKVALFENLTRATTVDASFTRWTHICIFAFFLTWCSFLLKDDLSAEKRKGCERDKRKERERADEREMKVQPPQDSAQRQSGYYFLDISQGEINENRV